MDETRQKLPRHVSATGYKAEGEFPVSLRVKQHYLPPHMFDAMGLRETPCHLMRLLDTPDDFKPLLKKSSGERLVTYMVVYKLDIHVSYYTRDHFDYPLILEYSYDYIRRSSKRSTARLKESVHSGKLARSAAVGRPSIVSFRRLSDVAGITGTVGDGNLAGTVEVAEVSPGEVAGTSGEGDVGVGNLANTQGVAGIVELEGATVGGELTGTTGLARDSSRHIEESTVVTEAANDTASLAVPDNSIANLHASSTSSTGANSPVPPLAEATWMAVNVDPVTRKPAPFPEWYKHKYNIPSAGEAIDVQIPAKPLANVLKTEHKVRFTEIDGNEHTNYVSYVQICLDVFYDNIVYNSYPNAPRTFLNGWMKEVAIQFKSDSNVGDVLTIESWQDDTCRQRFYFEISNKNKVSTRLSFHFYSSLTESSRL